MTKAEQVKSLLQGIQQDRQRYRALLGLLEQQREVMIIRYAEEMAAINKQLEKHYQQLERSAAERHTLLHGLGISPNAQGIALLLGKLPAALKQKASAMWEDLEHYASKCQAANERNGSLLSMQMELLHPMIHGRESAIYSG